MPIPVITNFSINNTVPFDTRLVATSSAALDAMLYKYEGLTTYRTDTKLNYTYNGSTWAVSSNGIYGGSGSLVGNTVLNFGTVSTLLNDKSNYFTFRGYDFDYLGVTSYVDLENYFIRNNNSSGSFAVDGVSYISQLFFNDPDNGPYYGPYIRYNPPQLFNSGIGGISFGTRNGNFGVSERMRIDGNGIIRFKPNTTVNDATKSVNIGIDSTDTRPFIGFNWNGSTPDVGPSASYVQFDNSVLSIHHFSSGTGTHSAIFSRGLVSINGNLRVSSTVNTANVEFGVGATIGRILNNYSGIIVNSVGQVDLVARKLIQIKSQPATPISYPVITYNADSITTTTATNIWDNNFDPAGESLWKSIFLNQPTNDGILVEVIEDTSVLDSYFYDFTLTLLGSYNSDLLESPWYLDPQPYDRYLYFYKEGNDLPIPHQVEWFLLNDLLLLIDPKALGENWVQIGKLESGDISSSTIPPIYQTIHYAQSVIIPANMYFKINFIFNETDQIPQYTGEFFTIKTRIIRSGKF